MTSSRKETTSGWSAGRADPGTRQIDLDPHVGHPRSRRAGSGRGGHHVIGATPDTAGGWREWLLIVPGMIIAAGSFAVFVETTSHAWSRRHLR